MVKNVRGAIQEQSMSCRHINRCVFLNPVDMRSWFLHISIVPVFEVCVELFEGTHADTKQDYNCTTHPAGKIGHVFDCQLGDEMG